MKNLLLCLCFLLSVSLMTLSVNGEDFPNPSAEMQQQVARLKTKGFTLTDYHIHLRGGMTAEKAFDWEKKSGVNSGVLENHGRDWPLSDNNKLAAFIEDARKFPMLVGIQVNDRDWFKTITPELRKQLDYILADTMIMNNKDGKPQKLWLENEYTIDEPDKWLEQYYQHCLTVVREPVTILANPTWLPPRMEKYYDKIWTPEQMEKFIDAAIENNVALEIQSPSEYPRPEFIKLAVKKGAKLSIGRNNHTDKPDELKRSLTLLEELDIKAENMFVLKLSPQNSKLNPITRLTMEELQKNFAAPHRDYSTGPLWTWNDRLTEEQVRSTLRDLAAQHVKQVWVHPRPGLMTPYLTDEWFARWNEALDEAKKLDMNVWIYDENSYPSGFAGGLVPDAMPESRGKSLNFAEMNNIEKNSIDKIPDDALYIYDETGKRITDSEIAASQIEKGKKYFVVRLNDAPASGWYAGKWHVDLLKKGVTEKFLDITLDAYAKQKDIAAEFGKRVPGIFTDEPHPMGLFHWTEEIPETFQKRFGYSIEDNLVSLFRPVGDWKRVRHNWHQIILDLFIENWSKPYFERTEKYGLEFTGHYWEHGWPGTSHGPDNMAMYAWHQRPAIDLLMNTYNDTSSNAQFGNVRSVKELASVANQMGHSRTLSENYGAGGWDIRFEDLKRLGDWSYALGVNTNNEHLSYVTIRGARKRDHPQSFSYHAPWFEKYHVLEDYFTRLSYVLSQGRQVNRILVIEPTTTAWMYQGTPELNKIGQSFTDFVNALERNQVEYDLASEDIIKRFGSVSRIYFGGMSFPRFMINKADYELVILPPHFENIDAKTFELLKQYVNINGQVLVCGNLPNRIDGKEAAIENPPNRVMLNCVSAEDAVKQAVIHRDKLDASLTVDGDARGVFSHKRLLEDGHVVFVCNSNQDRSVKAALNSRLEKRLLSELSLNDGTVQNLGTLEKYEFELPPCGSKLFSVTLFAPPETKPAVSPANYQTAATSVKIASSETSVQRLEPNVLTLDYVDVKTGGEEKKDVYTWAANRWVYQKHGFAAGNPWDNQVQFKDELLTKKFPEDSGFEAVYHFTVRDSVPKELFFVLERADLYQVFVNNELVSVKPASESWWLDKAFNKISIAALAKTGENTVRITAKPLTSEHELEPAYLLGDFSLENAGKGFVVVPPKALSFTGNIPPEEKKLIHSDEIEGVSWLSNGIGFRPAGRITDDLSPSLTFTFDKPQKVKTIRIWNYNERNLQNRGVKDMNITAIIGGIATLGSGKIGFPVAKLLRGSGTYQDIPLNEMDGISALPNNIGISTLIFNIQSNHHNTDYPVKEGTDVPDNGFVGLSEVQFIDDTGGVIKGVKVKASSELVIDSHNRKAAFLIDGSGLNESGVNPAAWNKQGMPFYAGKVEYKRTFAVSGTAQKYSVHFSDWYGAVAEVFVNGTSAGTVYAQTNDVDVTKLIKDGKNEITNEITVVIYGTPKNLLGPHHAGKLRGSAWPNAFQKAPEHQPAGTDYDVIEYGLFKPFELNKTQGD